MRGLSRNGPGCHIMLKFFWVFLMMLHRKKILVFVFPLLTELQNNCFHKIDDWHCNSFHSVDSYNNYINYSCK